MGTRIRTHITPKMRIISFVLAFVMVFVGLPYVGVNAAEGDITKQGAISSTTTQTSIVYGQNGQTAGLSGQTDTDGGKTYTYNGNIKTTNIELFDYFSDSEYGGTGSPSQSWDNGYSNPYDTFNRAVSTYTLPPVSYTADQTITIKYKPDPTKFNSSSTMYVELWHEGSVVSTGSPGKQMTWDSANSQFICTLAPAAYRFTDSFKPNKIKFSDGSTTTAAITPDTANNTLEKGYTYTIDQSASSVTKYIYLEIQKKDVGGNTWEFMKLSDIREDPKIHLWDDNNHATTWNSCPSMTWDADGPNLDNCSNIETYKRYKFNVSDFISDNGWTPTNVIFTFIIPGNDGNDVTRQTKNSSLDLSDKNGVRYYCWGGKEWDSTEYRDKYLVSPVEYGGESNIVTTQSSVAGSQAVTETTKYTDPLYFGAFYMSNNENGYTATNKPGMSGGGKAGGPYNNFYWQSHISLKGNTDDYSETRGRAALQGLVDNNLTGGVASGELQQGGKILPYFNESWANAHSNVMTYYNKDDTTSKSIAFPFYEVTISAKKGIGYQAGEHSATDSVAKYYQFNSELNNLYFKKGSANNSGHFVETSWGDHIKGDRQGSGNSTDNGKKRKDSFRSIPTAIKIKTTVLVQDSIWISI